VTVVRNYIRTSTNKYRNDRKNFSKSRWL